MCDYDSAMFNIVAGIGRPAGHEGTPPLTEVKWTGREIGTVCPGGVGPCTGVAGDDSDLNRGEQQEDGAVKGRGAGRRRQRVLVD